MSLQLNTLFTLQNILLMRFDYLVVKKTLQGLACLQHNNVVDNIEVAVANNTRKVRKQLEE